MLSDVLFGEYRKRVLGLLLLHPGQSYHVRELARLTNTSAGTLHKELSKLSGAGILQNEKVGNQQRYSANLQCPIFEELASILRKTSGLVDVVADALSSASNRIAFAFVFGSVARGEQHAHSDIDVMIIGDIGFGDVVGLLHDSQAGLKREINPVVYSIEGFQSRIEQNDSFIKEILQKPKLFIIGSEHELRKFTEN
ncbi:transcriptional regulator, ArsR family [Methylobacillus rhizosphaerae]|uniref:Transcriptional regulator, ArsR family n=1 Tax=Methylobacillus rhizosphaerae TaxID=551994 RepID=A0A238ZME5_9PROT|nr:nucleotidyltransferase domain-containing protein [Methylobacillus rhizosphaerae]SNR84299.1 transcriptional regulator, ArsR family [Methylobacillus rhizosphaerae]